jgi:hypothetical protein
MASRKNKYELVLKANIGAAPVPTLIHSPNTSLKKGQKETILGPDT